MRLYQGDWILYERRRRSKHRKSSEERYLVGLKTQHANFRGNPFYQTTKRHFEQQSDGEQCDGERRSVQRHCGPTSFGSVKATVSNWPVSDNSWADWEDGVQFGPTPTACGQPFSGSARSSGSTLRIRRVVLRRLVVQSRDLSQRIDTGLSVALRPQKP